MMCGMLMISSNGSERLRGNVFWLNLLGLVIIYSPPLSLFLSLSLCRLSYCPPPARPPPPPPHAFISFSACLCVRLRLSLALSVPLPHLSLWTLSFHPLSLTPGPPPPPHTHTPTYLIAPSTSYTSLCIMCLSVRLPLYPSVPPSLPVCLPLNQFPFALPRLVFACSGIKTWLSREAERCRLCFDVVQVKFGSCFKALLCFISLFKVGLRGCVRACVRA